MVVSLGPRGRRRLPPRPTHPPTGRGPLPSLLRMVWGVNYTPPPMPQPAPAPEKASGGFRGVRRSAAGSEDRRGAADYSDAANRPPASPLDDRPPDLYG